MNIKLNILVVIYIISCIIVIFNYYKLSKADIPIYFLFCPVINSIILIIFGFIKINEYLNFYFRLKEAKHKQKLKNKKKKNYKKFIIKRYLNYSVIKYLRGYEYNEYYDVFNEYSTEELFGKNFNFKTIKYMLESSYDCCYIETKNEYCFILNNNKYSKQIIKYLESQLMLNQLK